MYWRVSRKDWAEVKGMDEWYGEVHLHGPAPRWRWDTAGQVIRDTTAGEFGGNE